MPSCQLPKLPNSKNTSFVTFQKGNIKGNNSLLNQKCTFQPHEKPGGQQPILPLSGLKTVITGHYSPLLACIM